MNFNNPFDFVMRMCLFAANNAAFVHDLLPLSLLMLTNRAIFSPFATPPPPPPESFTAPVSVFVRW